MKMRAGTNLLRVREERKMTQVEMAELLDISVPTYQRIERNETSIELDKLVSFSNTLNIPIQEFLPDTLAINQNGNSGKGQVVFGNSYHYYTNDIEKSLPFEMLIEMQKKIEHLTKIIEDIKR
jgi:transcriptional regulator with XRE-family HTH domain